MLGGWRPVCRWSALCREWPQTKPILPFPEPQGSEGLSICTATGSQGCADYSWLLNAIFCPIHIVQHFIYTSFKSLALVRFIVGEDIGNVSRVLTDMEKLRGNPGHIWWVHHDVGEFQHVHLRGNNRSVAFAHHLDPIVEQCSTFCMYVGETPSTFLFWAVKRHHRYSENSSLPYKPGADSCYLLCLGSCLGNDLRDIPYLCK